MIERHSSSGGTTSNTYLMAQQADAVRSSLLNISMLVEFVIPKQKGRVGLQEVSLNHGDVAGEHNMAGQAASNSNSVQPQQGSR